MGVSDLLTTVEAAKLAGVTPSTVKRWADQGLLPCVKTAGGHRRFERAAIGRFLRAQGAASDEQAGGLATWVDLLVRGRHHELDGLLLEARARLGAWYRVADEIGSLLTDLGEQWAAGHLAIADEHLIADGLARGLDRLGQSLPKRVDGPRAVLACAEGDQHTLGLSLAELCLLEAGWTPLWLGRFTPMSEAIELAERSGARMIAVSASTASTDAKLLERTARRLGLECRARGIDLVLGGEGAWPDAPVHGVRVRSFEAFHAHVSR